MTNLAEKTIESLEYKIVTDFEGYDNPFNIL